MSGDWNGECGQGDPLPLLVADMLASDLVAIEMRALGKPVEETLTDAEVVELVTVAAAAADEVVEGEEVIVEVMLVVLLLSVALEEVVAAAEEALAEIERRGCGQKTGAPVGSEAPRIAVMCATMS